MATDMGRTLRGLSVQAGKGITGVAPKVSLVAVKVLEERCWPSLRPPQGHAMGL